MNNIDLRNASKNKKDEFYTKLEDIEKEMINYKDKFKNKIIYCNCDNPLSSNFYKYFKNNFNKLKLQKLICTYYALNKEAYKYEIYRKDNKLEEKVSKLKGDGDFRSEECINNLKKADIIITNPPFSLFREFVNILISYNKKFIIIGNQNAITYKEFFPLIKNNKVWLGASIHSGDREFKVPNDYPIKSQNFRIDENNNKYIRVKGIRWWTNIDYAKRYTKIKLNKFYNPMDYPKYDNYNAINVNKTKDIPKDYRGIMGVPITFLDKYNPQEFVLLGIMNTGEENKGIRYENSLHGRPIVNGKELYLRILIKRIDHNES